MSHPVASWSVVSPVESPGATLDGTGSTVAPGIDLELDSDGDLVVDTDAHFTTGMAAVAQGIRLRLQMFKGEWFLDLSRGVPYFTEILGAKFSQVRMREIFRAVIAESPGVDEIEALILSFASRRLEVTWRVRTSYGVTTDTLDLGEV